MMKFFSKRSDITAVNVTSGIKKQAEGAASSTCYKLVDLKGGGLLIELMKKAVKTKDFTEVDRTIVEMVEPCLYNKGAGKMVHIAHLVLLRNRDRAKTKLLPCLKDVEDPYKFDIEKYVAENFANDKDPTHYREVCWDLEQRGGVGETVLHLCLLSATSMHADLAKRLLKFYPKLIVDIYLDEEYYGENVLHIAIVNEDPAMVKYLLDHGVNYQDRCCGNFMSPEDQKASRYDSLTSEVVLNDPATNYDGYVYWGEYPLAFAACLGQEECYRLVLAKGADPNGQDTNGNTVLHMLVIYDKAAMFDMAHELGSLLNVRNRLGLTPLTLAAKLARRDMFFHILKIQKEVYWQLGNVTCSAYALPQLDTIDSVTGGIDKDSVLNLVVFGDLEAHLELMDDVVIDLLHAKWNTFIKFRFYRCFFLFALYFAISLICFTVRPGPPTRLREEITTTPIYTTTDMTWPSSSFPSSEMPMSSTTYWPTENDTIDPSTYDDWNGTVTDPTKPLRTDPTIPITSTRPRTTSNPVTSSVSPKSGHKHVPYDPTIQGYARMVGEAGVLIGVVLYLGAAAREARFLGRKMFFENLATAPSRVLFLISCMLVIAMVFLRWFCLRDEEDIVAVLVMLSTAPYFLFFCRGFKKVGPFVVMIYRMIMGDLLRFVTIYVVFVMGFSQAYYIVFLTHPPNREHAENPMPSPVDSVMMMFLMSLYNFGGTYEAFARTEHETVAKILFVIYMAIVGILLINMLIAMMGNTYTKIAETRNEWQRQWARIVLVVERGVDPKSRLENQVLYSQPMVDGRRAFMLRQQQSVEDLEEMKELDDIRTTHKRSVARRAAKLAEAQAAAKAGTNGSACPPPLITQNATLPITKTQF
ncbi:putative transient receptor potential cation channel subfamily V member 6 [Daphnia sinensis]|uniref:Transient receptor potential cation channel subfamily V member 6 n=1 Tax=Daphnia sinensis TaxID=1820382 RepID=A0AAD5PNR1_9CRUS|nr:putative transient receptor potential cation channel subfamily V member 6 [Daphnia sinensis]